MPAYRLDQEPWIPVVTVSGNCTEMSLLDAIERSAEIRRVAGNPLEAAVLMRLLMAIAHAVRQPADPYEWLDIWNDRKRMIEDMADHVRSNAGCFDLYDDRKPFAQNPALPVPTPADTPARIIYDRARGNNPVFLDHSVDALPQPVPSSVAARALLVLHSFGGSGTGGLNPLNGGKKDQMLAGPLCARTIALLEGEDLEKTIVLNLASGVNPGRPVWLRPAANRPKATRPEGVADLYTRATRAVRLKPSQDGRACEAASVFLGETLVLSEDGGDDPMIPRYLASDRKFKPFRISGDRALWRSAHVLLCAKHQASARPIRALEQLSPLASEGSFPQEEPVRLRVLGVDADAQGPVTRLWRDETLPFGLSVIADDRRYASLERAVEGAEEAGRQLRGRLYRFAAEYLADRAESTPDPAEADRLADEIAPDLADFWSEIGPLGERIALDEFDDAAWESALTSAAQNAYRRAIDRLPPSARRFRAEFHRGSRPTQAAATGGKTQ